MNYSDLFAAVCLVLVIEGLFLLVAPGAWRRVATQMSATSPKALRISGGIMIAAGLIFLQLVR